MTSLSKSRFEEFYTQLTQASSKDFLKEFIRIGFLYQEHSSSLSENHRLPLLNSISSSFSISEIEANEVNFVLTKMLTTLIEIIRKFKIEGESVFTEVQPKSFQTFLIDTFTSFSIQFTRDACGKICQGEKLLNCQWRVDSQLSNRTTSITPIAFLQLSSLKGATLRQTMMKMEKHELDLLFHELSRIKSQIKMLVE